MDIYLLPNHLSRTTLDPLGVSDDVSDDAGHVPLWSTLRAWFPPHDGRLPPTSTALGSSSQPYAVYSLISVLQALSYTLGTDFESDPDLCLLSECLEERAEREEAFVKRVCLRICELLDEVDRLWPSGELPLLVPNKSVTFTTTELDSLIALQFIGALEKPPWNNWGGVNFGRTWYGNEEVNAAVKTAYINIILSHLFPPSPIPEIQLKFTLSRCPTFPCPSTLTSSMITLDIVEVDEEDDSILNFQPCSVQTDVKIVSSHKLVGHGAAATQEEWILASYPYLLPISIFTPPLEDDTVLYVSSMEQPLLPSARFTGHGRSARLKEQYSSIDPRKVLKGSTSKKTGFLFMDAAELDMEETIDQGLVDFKPEMLERDFRKAYTGFSTCVNQNDEGKLRIIAIPWGAGAFGGDVRVKLLLMWIAASAVAREKDVEMIFLVKKGMIDEKEAGALDILIEMGRLKANVGVFWKALTGVRNERPGQDMSVCSKMMKYIAASKP